MKKILPIEKHILFFFSFAFLFLISISGKAQIDYSITTASVRMCGDSAVFIISVTNEGSTTVSDSVQLSLSYTSATSGTVVSNGLFISSPSSASSKVSFPGFVNNSPVLPVTISDITPGDSISITLTVRAGCNVQIGSSASLTASAEIIDGLNTILSSLNFQVLSNQNGTLSPQFTSHSSWDQIAQKGETVVRHFLYKNNTINSTFNGYLKFEDNLSGSVLQPFSIKVFFPGGDTTFSDTSSFLLPVSVNPGAEIRIEESVLVENCINTTGDGTSQVTISTGCFGFDRCNTNNFTLFVRKDQGIPVISKTPDPTWNSYFKCMGETDYTERQATFTNTGSFASNVNITFVPATDYITDTTSFRIMISGGDRIINGIFYRNPADSISTTDLQTLGSSIYGPYNNNLEKDILSFYRDLIAPVTGRSCNEASYLWSRVINHYIDSLGNIQQLDLHQGETLTIFWRDKSCCFAPSANLRGQRINTPTIRFFSESCELTMVQRAAYFSYDYFDGFQRIEAFNPMIAGNPDKCISTNDGEIREFTIRNIGISLGPNQKMVLSNNSSNWGSYVMELSLEKGLDLDLSLNGTAVLETYDPTCGLTLCDSTCNAQLWDTTGERYRIQFLHPTYGAWAGQVSKLPASGNIEHKYRITFDIDSIPGNPLNASQLEILFNEMSLVYSLRAYCGGGAQTNVFAALNYQPPCSTGCMIPLSFLDYHAVVTCPGCVTPGGNIELAVFERHTDYLGFVDANNDHIPDSSTLVSGLLRTNCANGDLMVNNLKITLSDGDKGRGGFELGDLPAGNHIDNLYLRYTIDKSIFDINGGAEVSFDGVSWSPVTTPPDSTASGYTFQVKSNDLGVADFHDPSHRTVLFRCPFKVRNDIPQGNPEQSYIVYVPYFSDCDTCMGGFSDQAENFSCNWPGDIRDSCRYCTQTSGNSCVSYRQWQENMGYFCQGGESMTTIYPSPSLQTINPNILGNDRSCSPEIEYWLSVVSGITDFPFEYRRWRFIEDSTNEITFRQQIPTGYRVSRIELIAHTNQGTTVRYADESDGLLTNISGIDILVDTLYVTAGFSYQGFNTPYTFGTLPYTGASFPIYDDRLHLSLRVRLQPVNCATVSADSFNTVAYVDPTSITPALIATYPQVRFIPLPDITVPSLAGNPAGRYTVSSSGAPRFNKPVTNLLANTITEVHTGRRKYYVPVFFDNTDPVDEQGNPLEGYGDVLKSINANYPFINFTNIPYLDSVGIEVLGVYEDTVSDATDLSTLTNFYDTLTAIARLTYRSGSQNLNYIPANTIQKAYTAVLEFTCPDACNPFLTDCNVAEGNYPDCVKEQKYLKMQYGWNCEGYPANSTEVSSTCNVRTLDSVRINTPPVALNLQTSLSSSMVELCEPFDYTISLKSCLFGSISQLFTSIELPDGVQYISNNLGLDTAMNGNLISFGDILADSSSFNQFDSTIVITLSATTLNNTGNRNIRLLMEGETYCGSPFTRGNFTPFDIADVLTGLNLNIGDTALHCVSEDSVLISPLIAGGTFSFTDTTAFALNADGSATFYPSQAGVGNYQVRYTLNDSCFALYDVIVTEITADAGSDTTICAGDSVQIGATQVAGTTYSWSPSTGLSSDTIANPVANPTVTTTYIVTVSNSVIGCVRRDTVVVGVNPSPNVQLSGTPIVCQGLEGTYSWIRETNVSYTFILPPGAQSVGGSGNATTSFIRIRFDSLGTYSIGLVGTNSFGCRDTSFVTVDVIQPTITGPDIVCSKAGGTQYSVQNITGVTYTWTVPSGAAILSGQGTNSIVIKFGATGGNVSVSQSNGCSGSKSVTIDNSANCCSDIYYINANSTWTSDTIGAYGVMTTIDADDYGGTVIFDGVYYMPGNVRLINGTFRMLPGTEIHVKSISGTTFDFCNTITGVRLSALIVDNATLEMNGAYLQAACNESHWMGIMGLNGSTIISDAGKVNGTAQNNTIRDSFYGIATNQNVCLGNPDNRIYIDSTTFYNFRYIGVFETGKNNFLPGEGVQNSIFFSEPATNNTICKNYSLYGIYITSVGTLKDYANLEIKNNVMHDIASGVLVKGKNVKIFNNRMYNLFRTGITCAGSGEIYRNKISVPSASFTKFGIHANDIVIGMELYSGDLRYNAGQVLEAYSNNIRGDVLNPTATSKQQIGILNIIGNDTRITDDTIARLDQGIWLTTAVSGIAANPSITKNLIRNNVTGIVINKKNLYISTSTANSPQIRCNDFAKTISFTGTSRGIWAVNQTFLSDLGTPTQPNGNKFSGIAEPMRNDGSNGGFDYYRYSSSEENLGAQIDGTAGGTIIPVPTAIANPVNACGGGTGVNNMKVSATSITEMMDSLLLKVGTEEDLKDYQREIVKHHEKNNVISDLEAYVATLSNSNPEAYNNLSLYLMGHFRNNGNESKAQSIKNQLKSQNPNDEEIKYQAMYFDATGRIWANPGKAIMEFSVQDSLELDEIVKSESSVSDLACLQLRMFTGYPCNFKIKDKSKHSEKRTGLNDNEEFAYLTEAVPNPANSETTIGYFIPENSYKSVIRVSDIVTGRLITEIALTDKLNGTVAIDLTKFASGVYIYTLVIDGNPVDSKKIVVLK